MRTFLTGEAIKNAVKLARASGAKLNSLHLLHAVLELPNCNALVVIRRLNVSVEKLLSAIPDVEAETGGFSDSDPLSPDGRAVLSSITGWALSNKTQNSTDDLLRALATTPDTMSSYFLQKCLNAEVLFQELDRLSVQDKVEGDIRRSDAV